MLRPLLLCFLLITSLQANARYYSFSKTWGDAFALHEVLEIIEITSYEFGWYFSIQEETRLTVTQLQQLNCIPDNGKSLLYLFKTALDQFLSYYPDEPLPFDLARVQMREYLEGRSFEVCSDVIKLERGAMLEKVYFIELGVDGPSILRVEMENFVRFPVH